MAPCTATSRIIRNAAACSVVHAVASCRDRGDNKAVRTRIALEYPDGRVDQTVIDSRLAPSSEFELYGRRWRVDDHSVVRGGRPPAAESRPILCRAIAELRQTAVTLEYPNGRTHETIVNRRLNQGDEFELYGRRWRAEGPVQLLRNHLPVTQWRTRCRAIDTGEPHHHRTWPRPRPTFPAH